MVFFTVKEVADICGVRMPLVLSWIESGQLKAKNVGKGTKRPTWRISERAVEEFMGVGSARK